MLAAGLPDPTVIEGEANRAKAVANMAMAMVAVMDVVNLELSQKGIKPIGLQVCARPPRHHRRKSAPSTGWPDESTLCRSRERHRLDCLLATGWDT